jgi:hypothetical protein
VNEDTFKSIYQEGKVVERLPIIHDAYECLLHDETIYFASKKAFHTHHIQTHGSNVPESCQVGATIQTLFKSKWTRYFKVDLEQQECGITLTSSTKFDTWIKNTTETMKPYESMSNIQELWLKNISEKLTWDEVRELTNKEDEYDPVVQCVEEALESALNGLSQSQYPNITKQVQLLTSGKELEPLRTKNSIREYSSTLVDFFFFICRGAKIEKFVWSLMIQKRLKEQGSTVEFSFIRDLTFCCLTELFESNASLDTFVVSDFLLVLALDRDDHVFEFSRTTQRISHLQYFIKLMVYHKLLEYYQD